MNKKTYSAPKIRVYGDFTEMTQGGGAPNADTPGGADGTAIPNAS